MLEYSSSYHVSVTFCSCRLDSEHDVTNVGHAVSKLISKLIPNFYISFPIVPNRLFLGRTKNNRHFGYPETKITDFKISGACLGTTLRYCRLILETETETGTKSRFHYLCMRGVENVSIKPRSNGLKEKYF